MSDIITLDETIEVSRSPREAFAYVADFSRIEEWDPGVAASEKLTEGAPGLGTEFRVTMKAGFSLHYRAIEWAPGKRVRFEVTSVPFSAVEDIQFTATPSGASVRYIARFRFLAPLRILARAFPGVMDRIGKSAMAGLKRALDDQIAVPVRSARVALADRLIVPGLLKFTRFGYQRARRHWAPVSAHLADRHFLITGATSGLGLATAETLAARGAGLTLVARDPAKAARVVAFLKQRTGNPDVAVEIAELGLMREVKALADRLIQAGRPIDALINNAGALINPREETTEGLEKSFALLLLGPFILTERLHMLLQAAASRRGHSRVINVLSGGLYTQRICVNDLQYRTGDYSGSVAYARAKRGLMIMTETWAERWQADGIVVNAMHPGWADTPGVESSLPAFHRLTRPLLRSPQEGADTIVWLATASEAAGTSGQFWLDRQIHPSHLFPHTRETPLERQSLLNALVDLAGQSSVEAPLVAAS